jgi:hypothetical protein
MNLSGIFFQNSTPLKPLISQNDYILFIMKLGVFSDSHDHLPNIQKVIEIYLSEKVDKIVHCGDLVAPFIRRSLTGLEGKKIETIGVYGNNDGERTNLNRILAPLMEIKGNFHEMGWSGQKIAVYHGSDPHLLNAIIKSEYDLVLTGHTHTVRVEMVGKTLVVNPGETCGYLTGKTTCAIIDLGQHPLTLDAVQIIPF